MIVDVLALTKGMQSRSIMRATHKIKASTMQATCTQDDGEMKTCLGMRMGSAIQIKQFSNKAKKLVTAVPNLALFETIDTGKLAGKLNKELGKTPCRFVTPSNHSITTAICKV